MLLFFTVFIILASNYNIHGNVPCTCIFFIFIMIVTTFLINSFHATWIFKLILYCCHSEEGIYIYVINFMFYCVIFVNFSCQWDVVPEHRFYAEFINNSTWLSLQIVVALKLALYFIMICNLQTQVDRAFWNNGGFYGDSQWTYQMAGLSSEHRQRERRQE